MKELEIFKYEEKEVRVIDKDGEPWWVAKDVCEFFGDTQYRRSTARLDTDEKGVSHIDTPGGKQQMTVINEVGLYSLLFLMQPQKAKSGYDVAERIEKVRKFKRWITHEVLPSIRKTGAYMTDATLEKAIADPEYVIGLLTELKKEQVKRVEVENRNKRLVHNGRTYTTVEIAKELNFKSAQVLNKELAHRGIQYKNDKGTWLLYAEYAEKDFVSIKQKYINGCIIYVREWTGVGREWLLGIFNGGYNRVL